MHKTHIFNQKDNAKFFLPTYLPYFFWDRYRKQTIYFLGPIINIYYIHTHISDTVLRFPLKIPTGGLQGLKASRQMLASFPCLAS